MPYPDFIGIGAQKAGTTWLSHHLQLHPEIWMPSLKEVHYFDEKINDPKSALSRFSARLFGERVVDRRWRRQLRNRTRQHLKNTYKKGLSRETREKMLWDLKYYLGTPGDAWYASLFEPGTGMVTGEITPSYSMLGPELVRKVHDMMPQARIVFMMRNPVERAWSQAVMQFGKSQKMLAEEASEGKLRRNLESEGSRSRTDYQRILDTWGAFYPEDQIFVGFLEDVHFFPEELLGRLYSFLGVDTSFSPPGLKKKVHSRSSGRIPTGVAVHLARMYREEISRLDERFGGYASFWHFVAQRLGEDPPEDVHLPYPLYESTVWDVWTSGPGTGWPRLASSPLSSLGSAGGARDEPTGGQALR